MKCVFDDHYGRQVCIQCGFVLPTHISGVVHRTCDNASFSTTCLAGTHLKTLLAGWPFRIVATPDCKCTSRASYMDAKGCDWCESPEGMAEILGFLREAAEERGLPFLDAAGRLLVKRAIHNARRKEAAANAQRPPHHDRGEKMAPPVHKIDG
jgi:hypothetical protein